MTGRKRTTALTLIELLVVLGTLAVLCTVGAAGYKAMLTQSDRSVAVSNLHGIGAALHQYVADHSGRLPGPLWPGQIPVPDPQREGRLVRELAPYLGITPSTQPAQLFVPPAFRRVMPAATIANSRPYVLNMAVTTPDGTRINPWGNLAAGGGTPLPIAAVPSSAWAMSDADQLHPRVRTAAWKNNTPPAPVHGPQRMALLFSGAVDFLSSAALE